MALAGREQGLWSVWLACNCASVLPCSASRGARGSVRRGEWGKPDSRHEGDGLPPRPTFHLVDLAQHAPRRAHRSHSSLCNANKPPHACHGARPRRVVVREAGAISRLGVVAGTARRAARPVRQQAELAQPRQGHGDQARTRHLHPRELPLLLPSSSVHLGCGADLVADRADLSRSPCRTCATMARARTSASAATRTWRPTSRRSSRSASG